MAARRYRTAITSHYESILDEGIVELAARLGHDFSSK
jgi:hypothetical protein